MAAISLRQLFDGFLIKIMHMAEHREELDYARLSSSIARA